MAKNIPISIGIKQFLAIPTENFAHPTIVLFSWKIVREAKFESLVSRRLT